METKTNLLQHDISIEDIKQNLDNAELTIENLRLVMKLMNNNIKDIKLKKVFQQGIGRISIYNMVYETQYFATGGARWTYKILKSDIKHTSITDFTKSLIGNPVVFVLKSENKGIKNSVKTVNKYLYDDYKEKVLFFHITNAYPPSEYKQYMRTTNTIQKVDWRKFDNGNYCIIELSPVIASIPYTEYNEWKHRHKLTFNLQSASRSASFPILTQKSSTKNKFNMRSRLFINRLEATFKHWLTTHFPSVEFKHNRVLSVDGSIVRPDFMMQSYNKNPYYVIIEVDEKAHSDRTQDDEQKRMDLIKNTLDLPVSFIRFNIHNYDVSSEQLIYDIVNKEILGYKLINDMSWYDLGGKITYVCYPQDFSNPTPNYVVSYRSP